MSEKEEKGLTNSTVEQWSAKLRPPHQQPFVLSNNYWSKLEPILSWVRKEIYEYDGISLKDGIHSFGNGEPFLALLHKFDSSLIDFENFDRSDPERTLSTVFRLVEISDLGIPNVLEPKDVMQNKDPRSLVLYLYLWRKRSEKILLRNKSAQLSVISEIKKLKSTVMNCTSEFKTMKDEYNKSCSLMLATCDPEALEEEKIYLDDRDRVMDSMVNCAMKLIGDLQAKNSTLKEQNKELIEKIKAVEIKLAEEEELRKIADLKLNIEAKIEAMGGEALKEEKTVEDHFKKL